MPARTTVTLPSVSIGGYGATCARLNFEALAANFMQHGKDIERLERELAAAIQRSDIAWAEIMKRNPPKES